jgi:thiamine-phosphate pyrophosphorylase
VIVQLVTDRRTLAGVAAHPSQARHCLLMQISRAVEAGIDVVQIRERDLEARELASLVTDIVGVTRGTRTRVVVNERVDVAIACGADGVHLRADSLSAAAVRAIAPPAFLIGRSVHSPPEARACGTAVDYLLAGTVWPTHSKPLGHALLGVTGLAGMVAAAAVPVLAIGGVTIERAREAAAAGAAGVASIGLFRGPEHGDCRTVHLTETVSRLRRLFDTTTPAS